MPQVVVPRLLALQYDGTNAAAIITFANDDVGVTIYSFTSEVDGRLEVASSAVGVWSDLSFDEGDYCVTGQGAVPQALFAQRYHVLGEA
jgi:hypothetical protein